MIQLNKFLIFFFVIILVGLLLFISKIKIFEKFETNMDSDMDSDMNLDTSINDNNLTINIVKCDKYPTLCSKPSDNLEYNPYLERRSFYINQLNNIKKRYSPAG
jgi:hypothetical protein